MPLFHVDDVSAPSSARELDIKPISMRTAQELNRSWHSVLPHTDLGNLLCGNMSLAYGAMFADKWYGVAIYSQPIIASMCDGHTIELRRLAICDQAPKNTASRMMAATRKLIKVALPHIRRVISYQAVDVHLGTIYKADNWRLVSKMVAARPQRFYGSKQRATRPLQTESRKQRWERNL